MNNAMSVTQREFECAVCNNSFEARKILFNMKTITSQRLLFQCFFHLTTVNFNLSFKSWSMQFSFVNCMVSSCSSHVPYRILPLRLTRANVHMISGGTVMSIFHFLILLKQRLLLNLYIFLSVYICISVLSLIRLGYKQVSYLVILDSIYVDQ